MARLTKEIIPTYSVAPVESGKPIRGQRLNELITVLNEITTASGTLVANTIDPLSGGETTLSGNVAITGATTATALLTATTGVVVTPTAVTQATNISTGVTITGAMNAEITTVTATTAAVTTSTFTVTATACTTTSVVQATLLSYSGTYVTNGIPIVTVNNRTAGTFDIKITNAHASNALNGILKIGITILS